MKYVGIFTNKLSNPPVELIVNTKSVLGNNEYKLLYETIIFLGFLSALLSIVGSKYFGLWACSIFSLNLGLLTNL